VNTFDYVNRKAQEVGAMVTAYLLTDPAARTALKVSKTVTPYWPAVQAEFMVHDVVSYTFDVTAPAVSLLDFFTDLARSFAGVGDILPSFDQLTNMGLDAMKTYNDVIDGTADMIRPPEPMEESAPPFSTSMEEQGADEKRQAEWKETARADQQQREQAQRDADSRVADQLEAALQKDADFRKAQAQEKAEQERQAAEQKAEPEQAEPEKAEQERQAAEQKAEPEQAARDESVYQEAALREAERQEAERLAEERRRAIEQAREAMERALAAQRAAREAAARER
jgi:hypothetical protein